MKHKLTEPDFWENFWNSIKLPQKVNYDFHNDQVIAESIKSNLPRGDDSKTVLEIGCAPGKWLVMFNKELDYNIEGIEYIKIATEKTIENMLINEIPKDRFNIYNQDFLKFNSSKKYDVVYSLGFIEHFDNYNYIIQKHLNLVKKGGYLIFGIPNFRGLNYIIQKFIDGFQEVKLIPKHNLKIMKLKFFANIAKEYNISIKFLDYIGGFEPALFSYESIKNRFLKFSIRKFINLNYHIAKVFHGAFNSSYIMAIYKNE